MKPAKEARQCLQGQWRGAMFVQWVLLTGSLLLLLLEIWLLRVTGIGMEKVLHMDGLLQDLGILSHAMIILGVVLIDLFLISPLKVGQAAYYYQTGTPARSARVPSRLLFSFFAKKQYKKALYWRLCMWGLQLGWGFLCYLPACALLGYGQLLFQKGAEGPMTDISVLFCAFFGLFALIAGYVTQQLLLLRYMPAQYFLEEEKSVWSAFHRAKKLMRRGVGETAWMYAGFSGWLLSCILIVPYFYAAPLFQTSRALWVHQLQAKLARKESLEWAQTRSVEGILSTEKRATG